MNKPFACLIGASVIIMSISLTFAIIQENSSTRGVQEITLNNTTFKNTSLNSSPNNDTNTNITIPENIGFMNSSTANVSSNLSGDESKQSSGTFFAVGSGSISNESAHNLDIPTSPAKNASYLWYVIQAKPHGYV